MDLSALMSFSNRINEHEALKYPSQPPLGNPGLDESNAMPIYIRYGTVAVLAGLSAWKFSDGDESSGTVFAVMAGIDVFGNLLYDLIGQ